MFEDLGYAGVYYTHVYCTHLSVSWRFEVFQNKNWRGEKENEKQKEKFKSLKPVKLNRVV